MSIEADLSARTHEAITQPIGGTGGLTIDFKLENNRTVRVQLGKAHAGDPKLWELMSMGLVRRFTIHPVGTLIDDGVTKSYDAVAYSDEASQLIFLQRGAVPKVVYRRLPIAPLRVQEVSIVG